MVSHLHTGKQGGAALVIVLWLLVLLSVIGGSHARNARMEAQLASNQLKITRTAFLAEAGLNRAVLEMLVSNQDERWKFDGTVYPIEFDAGRVEISIRNAAGLVDLNTAGASVLRLLLTLQEMSEEKRDALVDAILDWRDPDDLRRINGAEDADYRFAGLEYGTPDTGYRTIEELGYLLGMNRSIFDAMAPYLTLYSGLTHVEPRFAPPELLGVVSGSVGDPVEEVDPAVGDEAPPDDGGAGLRSAAYHISVAAQGVGGSSVTIEAVVTLSSSMNRPYTVLSWRQRPIIGKDPDA